MLSLDAAVLSAKVISGPVSERKIKLGPDATVPPVRGRMIVLGLDATVPPAEERLCWAWMLLFRRPRGRMIIMLGRSISPPPAENERRQVQVK